MYGLLKNYYNNTCIRLHTNPGTPMTILNVAECFGKAYQETFTPKNVQAGFKAAGIWPMNRNIVHDSDFDSALSVIIHNHSQLKIVKNHVQMNQTRLQLMTNQRLAVLLWLVILMFNNQLTHSLTIHSNVLQMSQSTTSQQQRQPRIMRISLDVHQIYCQHQCRKHKICQRKLSA